MAKRGVLGIVAFHVCHCLLEPRVWRHHLLSTRFSPFFFSNRGKNQRGTLGACGSEAPSLVDGEGACEPVTKTSLQLEEALGRGGVRAQPGGEFGPRLQNAES